MGSVTQQLQCILFSVANVYGVDHAPELMHVCNNIIMTNIFKYLPCARQRYKCFYRHKLIQSLQQPYQNGTLITHTL